VYSKLRPDIFVVDFSFIDHAITDAVRNVRNSSSDFLSPWLRVELEYEGCMELCQKMKPTDVFQRRKLLTFILDRTPIPPNADDLRVIEQFAGVDRSNFFMGLNNKITPVLSQYVLSAIRPRASTALELVLRLPDDKVHAHIVKHSVTEGTFYKCSVPHRFPKGSFLDVHSCLEVDSAPKACCVKYVPRDYGFAVFQSSDRSVTYGLAVFKPSFENDDILNAYFFLDPASESSICMRIHPKSKSVAR
jgi:hypothetical protein